MNNQDNCLASVIRLIDQLQRQSECSETCDNTCSRPFLGKCSKSADLNTRPVTFYTCDNNLITIEYNNCGKESQSSIFRVNCIEDNCVTVTILAPNHGCEREPYINTNQTAIINLDCCCAIKCLPDTTVCL